LAVAGIPATRSRTSWLPGPSATPAGLKVFETRDHKAPAKYSFENKPERLDAPLEKRLRASGKAWAFFSEQPPWYQRTMRWYVMSAARDETRLKRLDRLLADSARGVWIAGIMRDKQPRAKASAKTFRKPRAKTPRQRG